MGKPTIRIRETRRTGRGESAETLAQSGLNLPIAQPAKPDGVAQFTAEDRRAWVSRAAYFRAEQRRFAPGRELEDWLAAEREAERALSSAVASTMAHR